MFDMSLRLDAAGPKGVPLVNNLKFMATSADYATRVMAPFHDQPVIPVTRGHGSVVLVTGEQAVRQVFTDNDTFHRAGEELFDLPKGRTFSGMFDAVITANGDEHRRRRRLLMPVVQKSAMDHYREIFADTFHHSRFADAAACDEPFDMAAEFLEISMTNLLRGMLGLPDSAENRELAALILSLTASITHPAVILFRHDAAWTPYGRWVRRVAAAYERLAELIEQRRQEPPRWDALSIVCNTTGEDGERLSTSEIAGELHAFFSAGFETTALTLTWALLTIIARPAGSGTAGPLGLDLTDETVLDAVVKESQRLLPAVPISLPRRVVRDVEIAGSAAVPRGAMLWAASIVEHHRPESYPEPEVFLPRRWLDAATGPRPHEFFPYGIGARRCLGAAFADLQVRVTLGLLARQRRQPELLTREVAYRMRSGVSAAPRGPVLVRLGPPGADRTPVTGGVTAYWRQ